MRAKSISKSSGREAQDSSVRPVNLKAEAKRAAKQIGGCADYQRKQARLIESLLQTFGGHVVAVVTE